MRILVTGSSGFVGQATNRLLTRDHVVIPFDIMDGRDIRDEALLASVIQDEKPERILHLAAIARFADADADPLRAHSINVLGSEIVARQASQHHIPLVYASTGSVYMPIKAQPPITEDFAASGNSVYGCTKYMGELMVRRSEAPWIILRYAHLYGHEKRGHGLIGSFVERIERGLAPTLYGGQQSSDFTYIEDVARANLLALTASWDKWNQVYNIGTGEELTAEDAGKMICDVFDFQGAIHHGAKREVDAPRFVYDCSKASSMLNFTAAYGFRQGLEAMRSARIPVQ